MPSYLDALASERAHTRKLYVLIFFVTGLAMFAIWMAWRTPKSINVHLLPSVSAGSTVQVRDGESEVPPQNVYAFAYYIWQQVNRWTTDGAVDYGQQIYNVQNFITPQCRALLEADIAARSKEGELKLRTRTISEIPGFGYAPNRVVDEGNHTAWTVFLDTQVQETYRGQAVKDIFIRYPIRVVRYDVDRERNPWQLAIDCYGQNRPTRLSEEDLRVTNPATRKSERKAPPVPGAVAPAPLPQTAPLQEAPASTAATPAASEQR